VQGHRGYGNQAPANTLAAFRSAAVDSCMHSVEFDVRVTGDGHLVVTHGPEMPGVCSIDHSSLAELQAVDLGEGERMPLLADVVDVCLEGGLLMNVEIKPGTGPEKVEQTVQLLRSKGALPSCRISSFDRDILRQVMRAEPTVPIGALSNANIRPVDPEDPSKGAIFEEVPEDFLSWFGDHRIEGDSVNVRAQAVLQAPSLVEEAKAMGKRVLAWCPSKNDPGFEEGEALYRQLIELGVDVICTNYPDVLASVLQQHRTPSDEPVASSDDVAIVVHVMSERTDPDTLVTELVKPKAMNSKMTILVARVFCIWLALAAWCHWWREIAGEGPSTRGRFLF